MPPKTKTSGNKRCDDDKKLARQISQRDQGTRTNPLVIDNSKADETETASKPDEEDLAHRIKDDPSQSFDSRDTSSASGHLIQLITRVAAATFKMLQKADDPDRSPSREDEHFQGSGLWDNILQSQARRKSHSRPTIQQPATDAQTRAMMSVPITTVPPARVLVDDLLNFASRPGSSNPLKVAAGSDKLPADSKQKKLPGPPDLSRVFTELPSDTRGRKPEPLAADSNPAENQPQALLVAVYISVESDFAADLHQMIPSEPCYSPPLRPTAKACITSSQVISGPVTQTPCLMTIL